MTGAESRSDSDRPAAAGPVVDIRDVRVSFGEHIAVESLSLTVERGERVAILGQTGAGKSTILGLLVGRSPRPGAWSASWGRIPIGVAAPCGGS